MANIKSVESKYFDGFAAELNGKFKRIGNLLPNTAAEGSYHEEIIRTVLRNFLTNRFSVKTGFIYKSETEVSRQMDILIIDESSPAAYIFQEGDFVIVMPEAVIAFAEIKTTLDSSQFKGALNNTYDAKALFEFPASCPGFIFGFQSVSNSQSKMTDKRAASWLGNVDYDNPDGTGDRFYGPDGIIWLNDNYSLFRFNAKTQKIGDGVSYSSFHSPAGHTGWQLSLFLAIVVSACERAEFNKTRLFGNNLASRLLDLGEVNVSETSFRIGRGQNGKNNGKQKEEK